MHSSWNSPEHKETFETVLRSKNQGHPTLFPCKDGCPPLPRILNNSHYAARSIIPQRNITLQNNPIFI